MLTDYVFTSESVNEGHPDKVCDQISDAVLDALLADDPDSRVACEALVKTGLFVIAGEITTQARAEFGEIAKQVIRDIGYTSAESGFNCDSCAVVTAIERQSPDISQGVTATDGKEHGAGLLPYPRPDGKCQVSVEYRHGQPVRAHTVVVSTQHTPDIASGTLKEAIVEEVVKKVIPTEFLD